MTEPPIPRTLFVTHTGALGGAELSLLELLRAMPSAAIAGIVTPPGPLADRLKELDLEIVPSRGTSASLRLHPLYTPRALARIFAEGLRTRAAARRLGAQVVMANTIRAGLIAAAARATGGPPVVTYLRDVLPQTQAARVSLRVVAAWSVLLVANSRYTADRTLTFVPRAPITVAYPPVDVDRFSGGQPPVAARAELGLPAADSTIGIIGQITRWKGQHIAIEVLAGLRERGHDVRLVVAGSAKFVKREGRSDNQSYRASLSELCDRLGLADHVSFVGERQNVPALVSALDVVVVPSSEEPFGRVVVEAMAGGRAVVATSVGGPAEIIGDGDELAGLLLDPADIKAWTDAVDDLLSDDVRRDDMAARAPARARAISSPERHAAAVGAALRSACGDR